LLVVATLTFLHLHAAYYGPNLRPRKPAGLPVRHKMQIGERRARRCASIVRIAGERDKNGFPVGRTESPLHIRQDIPPLLDSTSRILIARPQHIHLGSFGVGVGQKRAPRRAVVPDIIDGAIWQRVPILAPRDDQANALDH